MSAQGLERSRRRTVGDVNLAVSGTAADQQTRLVHAVLDKAQVPDCAVVHRQLDLATLQLLLHVIVLHQLHRLVVGSGGDQVSHRRPRHAINRTLVVLCALEQHGRLERCVFLPAGTENSSEPIKL